MCLYVKPMLSGIAGGEVRRQSSREDSVQVLQHSNLELPYNPAIPFLGMYPKELKERLTKLFVNPSSQQPIHRTQKVEAT